MTDNRLTRATLAAQPFPPNPWVQVTDDAVIIKAGYSDTLHRMLRWVPKVQWLPEQRHWRVPLSGAELIRSVLPEISRLAEATHEEIPASANTANNPTSGQYISTEGPVVTPNHPPRRLFPANASDRDLFRNAARFLFGTDWQRDTARALGREESTLACWLVGQEVVEDDPQVLLIEMLALMRKRSESITAAAERLAEAIDKREHHMTIREL